MTFGLAFLVPGVVSPDLPEAFAAYFVPTVLVPLLLVTHVLVFRILLRADVAVDQSSVQSEG